MKTRWIVLLVLFNFLYCFNSLIVSGADYPTRPIEILIASGPGGGVDLGARMIAEKSREYLKQELIVNNKGAGGHRTTLTSIAKAKPDGYLLGALTESGIILSPHMEKINYKPFEYTFLCQYGILDFGIYVLPDSPFKTFKDVIDYARANPSKLTMGITQINTTNHMALLAICLEEGIKMTFIPMTPAPAVTAALLGGHIMVASTASSGYARFVRAKQVRMLALMNDERMDAYPGAPTLKELGYPSLVFESMYVMIGPNKMEKSVSKKLEETFKKALESPEFVKLAKDLETWPNRKFLFGDELKQTLMQRSKNYEALITKLGLGIKQW